MFHSASGAFVGFPSLRVFSSNQRGNIVAKTLRKMFTQQCLPICARKKHLLRKQSVSEKNSETFFIVSRIQKRGSIQGNATMFPQQFFLVCMAFNSDFECNLKSPVQTTGGFAAIFFQKFQFIGHFHMDS